MSARINLRQAAAGFTLIEMVMSIIIAGIVAAMVATFIKAPIDSFIDSGRRAELTDVADTMVRRISREIHLALPNSVRNPDDGSASCVEFIPTIDGGRYRQKVDAAGAGNPLEIGVSDSAFDYFGASSPGIVAGDVVVVFNTSNGSGGDTSSAYSGYNAVKVQTAAAGVVILDSTAAAPFDLKAFPFDSPSWRFQVISKNEHVAGFACGGVGVDSNGNGTGTLYRYSRTLTAARVSPANCTAVATGATAATLATNISACTLKYEPPGSSTGLGNNGILVIGLEVRKSNEPVSVYQQVLVDNTP